MSPERRVILSMFVTVGLLIAGLASGFLIGWLVGDGTLHDWVLSYAGAAELFGVLLVASPEIVPLVQRGWAAAKVGWGTVKRRLAVASRWIRRRLGRKPKPRRVEINLSDAAGASDAAMSLHTPSPTSTLEETVAFLLRRDQQNQEHLQRLEVGLYSLPGEWRSDIEKASGELEGNFGEALRQLEEKHLRARLIGLVLLIVGIALNTWGNLI